MGQILELIPADGAGWMAVIESMAAFALLLRLDQARKDRRNKVVPAPPGRQLEPGSEWQRVMDVSLVEITRSPDLQSMQARAAAQSMRPSTPRTACSPEFRQSEPAARRADLRADAATRARACTSPGAAAATAVGSLTGFHTYTGQPGFLPVIPAEGSRQSASLRQAPRDRSRIVSAVPRLPG